MTSEIHKALIRVKLETLLQLQLGLAQRIGKNAQSARLPKSLRICPQRNDRRADRQRLTTAVCHHASIRWNFGRSNSAHGALLAQKRRATLLVNNLN